MSDNGEGKIFWVDLTTPDPQRAKTFYGELFSWEYAEEDRGAGGFYRMVSVGGRPFGGMLSMAEIGMPEDDVPAHWMPYFYTERVDEITANATAAGATVYAPPRDIPGISRLAVIGDPQGGTFSPMQPLMEGDDPSADLPVGAPIWYELQSPDQSASAEFYANLFGLTADHQDMGTGTYVVLKKNGLDVGGVDQAPPGVPLAGWCPYMRITDIEATRNKIEELGGKILSPVIDVPDTGQITVAMDPIGAVFGLLVPSWL